jgi:OmpA-OmpF porin, OOP family
MPSLIDSLSTVSPETVRSLAARFSEPNELIQRGVQTSGAIILGVIVSRANEPVFMSQVTNMMIAFGGSHPAGAIESGSAFLAALFGNDRSLVERKIAEATGLAKPSATAVLAGAAPLLLTILSPKVASSTLHRVVTDELPNFVSLIPAGIPGQSRLPALAADVAAATRRKHRVHSRAEAGKHWLWQLLLLGGVLIAALVWYSYRGATVPAN